MSTIIYDLQKLYQYQFGGKPYQIDGENENRPVNDQITSDSGNLLQDRYLGKEIWLPVKFFGLDANVFENGELFLPYSVISISLKKTIIKTAMAERRGTVKELYNIEDYQITLKGFVIDEDKRLWPEKEITYLKNISEEQIAVSMDNALTNIFLKDSQQRVVIEDLVIPEVEGGRKHIRPFSMKIESDSVFTLELK
jgi:hypothetical protein